MSMRESRISPITAVESCPCSSAIGLIRSSEKKIKEEDNALNAASITLISVAVVSSPVKAHQSFTIKPAPMTSEPRFTVPAYEKPMYCSIESMKKKTMIRGYAQPMVFAANCSAHPDLVRW